MENNLDSCINHDVNSSDSLEELLDKKSKPKPVIPLVPQHIYQKLHREKYPEVSGRKLIALHDEIERLGIKDLNVKDESSLIDLPIPRIKAPLSDWLETSVVQEYAEWLSLIPSVMFTPRLTVEILPELAPKVSGWSKWDVDLKQWVSIPVLDSELIFFDFEAYSEDGHKYKPFLATAVSAENEIYCWVVEDYNNLPNAVSFGETVKLYIGQNSVSFDRTYVEEFYEFGHRKRMLDTLSLYQVVYGMSTRQKKAYSVALKRGDLWAKSTMEGNLEQLAYKLCGIKLDKGVKDLWVRSQNKPAVGTEVLSKNLDVIFRYCLQDTIATKEVFKALWKELDFEYVPGKKSYIYICGQLERSSLRIGVRRNIDSFCSEVRAHNRELLTKMHEEIKKILIQQIKDNHKPLIQFLIGISLKDWYGRIYKSTPFRKWALENVCPDMNKIQLPPQLLKCGWEDDENDTGGRRQIKLNTLQQLKQVHYAIDNGFITKIQRKTSIADILRLCWKDSNEKVNTQHISVTGKMMPLILGMKWNNKYLEINKNTWGIYTQDGFIPLVHPKGKESVGTPLAKDFVNKVTVGEFTSKFINLKEVYKIVDETQLWEKFDKRFRAVLVHRDVWLPNVIPSGTLTGRPTGALAVVLTNDKPNQAGSEMKTLFSVSNPDHRLLVADYKGQESEIFCANIAAENKYCGLNIFEVINSTKDIHTYVAAYLFNTPESEVTPEQRQLAKCMNFANQFMCGLDKLTSMLHIAFKGQKSEQWCMEISQKFQRLVRGENNYGKYEGGLASVGFNRTKKLALGMNQKCLISGRLISKALRADVCKRIDGLKANGTPNERQEELTTRINFTIQTGGQSLMDICCMVIRYFATRLDIKYQFAFMIHDQLVLECHKDDAQDLRYLMQIGHLFSKAVMYYRLGVHSFPIDKMWFELIEEDYVLRKSPLKPCITPTQKEELALGTVVKAEDCLPTSALLDKIKAQMF
jgi:hypothetical protein